MFIKFITNPGNYKFSRRVLGGVTLAISLLLVIIIAGGHIILLKRAEAASQTKRPVETPSILLTLTRKGFEPSEVTIPKGPFFLIFENRSGIDSLDLQFNKVQGNERLKDFKAVKEEPEWIQFLDLNPGEYVLNIGNRPELSFRLQVTSK